ncbi:hypothetical protein AAFF_G00357800 [Aldrovandia affinis]|uniref:SET domain-containing protein n=1 Tax=Aldrovandia affinis TaxID=143900 RepID=A0AAD7T8Y1_9TELE|nr:hypothetical protein AAFF_G00357800 [Aldrovandia affinis]
MAENIRSLFDYREPPTLDSDGEGSKPPPPRGRGCGRKRKGTPVKVCDRVFVTEDEEESLSEHSYCPGDGQYQEGEDDRLPPPDSPYYLSDPAQLCVSELGEEGGSGARAAMLYAPPANCRIREVHCGSQVRLVVIAIRDIAKGEEITVDYSLTEWGDNAMSFHSSVSPGGLECSSDPENNIKKEDESAQRLRPRGGRGGRGDGGTQGPHAAAAQEAEGHVRAGDQAEELPQDPQPAPFSRSPHSSPPPCRSFASPSLVPTTNINNNININIGRGRGAGSRRQQCLYCGRHFRSLARHLEKHHAQQPEVRAAMERTQLYASPPLAQTHPAHPHPQSQPHPTLQSASSATPPPLFSRERDPQSGHGSASAVSFSLSLSSSPPSLAHSATAKKSPALAASPRKSPSLSSPPKKGRRMKKEKEEEKEKRETTKEEEAPPPGLLEGAKDGEAEPNGEKDEESGGEEKKGELLSSRRPHMLPLLSSLSSLVAYLRRQQHSSFLSLSRAPQAAEAWRLLCHSSLALLILYNRRRECEVSKLTVQEYQNRVMPPSPGPASSGAPPTLTPLEASLSPFERQVLSHLPRAGVLGKRGRVQPLILPPHSEPCLELLLQARPSVGVDPQNPYLFARPYHSPATPLRGADLLRSLARASGTKNPQALTQTRRLEDFLQKEYHVTQSCARIGQDPGLMGRVGRVVLCGERDGVLFRGMSLHHICLELDVMSGNSADSLSDDSEGEPEKAKQKGGKVKKETGKSQPPRRRKASCPPTSSSGPSPATPAHKRRTAQPKTGKRGVLKRPWTEAERSAVEFHLNRNIAELRVPAKADCERCLQLCPLLVTNRRDWRAIKFYCHNRIQLLKKKERRESGAHGVGCVHLLRRQLQPCESGGPKGQSGPTPVFIKEH